MTLGLGLTVLAILVLLVLSAFFSGSETALTAVSRARIHQMERNGDRRAGIVGRLIQTRERLIGALLLGNNLVNILASSLATSALLSIFGDAGVAAATIVMTVLILIFSEVGPKTFAIANPDRTALLVAPLVRIVVAVFGPVMMGVEFIVKRMLKLFGTDIDDSTPVLSAHEELRGAVDLLHLEGGLVRDDRNMLGGLLDLRELEVSDVMVHRTKMQMLNAGDAPSKIVGDVLGSPFTRLPLWRDQTENIVGVLHAKDLLRALETVKGEAGKLDIMALASPPWFVPNTTSLPDQLKAFLRQKQHFALVVDEYGMVMGLVTLEDILEEIVGDIADEHDVVVSGVRIQTDGTVHADGGVPIRDLNRALGWDLPDDEATTIAGLVIHAARSIPEPGQAFTFFGFKFQVVRRQRNRITALRITPPARLRRKPGKAATES